MQFDVTGHKIRLILNETVISRFGEINWPPRSYTYIIGHYNPSVRIIDLVSYTTYVVCVKLIHKWRNLQFKVDRERQIFWETFHQFLFTLRRVFARNLLKRNRRRNTFRIAFCCLGWNSNPAFSPNKPTHYLLDRIYTPCYLFVHLCLAVVKSYNVWHKDTVTKV